MTSRPVRLRDAGRGLALAALLLYTLNMRGPITALAPVIGDVSADLHLTAAAAGLLTGAPVLVFALTTPLAAAFVVRRGTALAVTASLLSVLVGTVLRTTDGFAAALTGTVLIGLGISVGNVAVPVVIARDFSSGVARVTGVTTASMNVGAVLTTMGMAPLAALVGWRWALASWVVVTVGALAVWWRVHGAAARAAHGEEHDEAPRTGGSAPDESTPDEPTHDEPTHDEPLHGDARSARHGGPRPATVAVPSVWRRPVTWLLAVTFATQASSYYALSAWLPSILHDDAGLSVTGSGAAAALFQAFGIAGSLLAPLALHRLHPRAVTLGIAALWLVMPVGLALAPGGWPAWTSAAGVAQAANYVVIMSVVAIVAGSPAAAARMSAIVQTCGYVMAGVWPSVLGAIHSATGGWRVSLAVVTACLVVMAVLHTIAIGALIRHRAGSSGTSARLASAVSGGES